MAERLLPHRLPGAEASTRPPTPRDTSPGVVHRSNHEMSLASTPRWRPAARHEHARHHGLPRVSAGPSTDAALMTRYKSFRQAHSAPLSCARAPAASITGARTSHNGEPGGTLSSIRTQAECELALSEGNRRTFWHVVCEDYPRCLRRKVYKYDRATSASPSSAYRRHDWPHQHCPGVTRQ